VKLNRLINGLLWQRSRALRWREPVATLALFVLISSGFALVRASAGERFVQFPWPARLSRIFGGRTATPLSPPAPVPVGSDPTPQTLPYSQNFSSLAASSTTYPAGWQGWNIASSANTSFKTVPADADSSLIANSGASNNAGGVHNYDGKIGFLQTGSDDPNIALAIDTTDNLNVKVSYDIMTIRNPYNGTTNIRINHATLQYRVGTSGSFTSLTGVDYITNSTMQTGSGVTTPQNSETKTVFLPPTCDNQPVVQLRWVGRDVGGAGSRPSFAVDNISVQGTQFIVGTLFDSGGSPITTGRTIKLIQNGTVSATTATTDSLGLYFFSGLLLASGDRISVFVDGAAEKGATATLIGTPDNVGNFDIKASQLTVRTDNGGTPAITNSDLANSDSSKDPDIPFTVASGTLSTTAGTSLQINSGSSYAPGGNINDGGNWINNGAFTPGSNTVTFNGTANQSIGGTNSTSFATLIINPSNNAIVSLAVNTTVTTALNINTGVFSQGESGTSDFSLTTNAATVSSGSTWRNLGKGDLTLTGDVSNSGTINFNGNGAACEEVATNDIQIRSDNTTQRTWTGTGTFSFTDVDVDYQKVPGGLTLPLQILVNSGTDVNSTNAGTRAAAPGCLNNAAVATATPLMKAQRAAPEEA
jgi:hypothetical protein